MDDAASETASFDRRGMLQRRCGVNGLRIAFLVRLSHARLLDLDVTQAAALDGVHLVATQADLDADNVGEISVNISRRYCRAVNAYSKPPMMRDLNRHAGDIVAMVVADTQQIADDALAVIAAEFDPLPAVTDVYVQWPMGRRSSIPNIRKISHSPGVLARLKRR